MAQYISSWMAHWGRWTWLSGFLLSALLAVNGSIPKDAGGANRLNGQLACVYDAAWNPAARSQNVVTNRFTVIVQDSSGRKDTNVVEVYLPLTVVSQYDLNGNVTSDGRRSFEYDPEDRLEKITVTNVWKSQFHYDGLGRRRVPDEYLLSFRPLLCYDLPSS